MCEKVGIVKFQMGGNVLVDLVVAVVDVVGVVGVRLGSQTMLPPQELLNTWRPVLGSVHLLEASLHFLLEDQLLHGCRGRGGGVIHVHVIEDIGI